RPARMPHAVHAIERFDADRRFEIRELAGAATTLDQTVFHDRHAGRVVPAILETAQAVDQNRNDFFRAEITNDAAHNVILKASGFRLPTSGLKSGVWSLSGFRFLLLRPLFLPAFDVPL